MSMAYNFMMPNMMTWGEFFAKGASADYEPGRDYRAALTTPGAVLGSPMALLIWGSVGSNWPANTIAAQYRQVQPSDVETLLISGSIDFSTPAQFAEQELLPALHKGQHVVIAEQGHVNDFWGFQPEARQRLLTSFYDTGKADASLYQTLPMNFKPAMRFPVLAKILVGVSILLVFGLVWAAWSIARRISQRKAVPAIDDKNMPHSRLTKNGNRMLLVVIILAVLASLAFWYGPARPPAPGGINRLEQVQLGGVRQWISIRGVNRKGAGAAVPAWRTRFRPTWPSCACRCRNWNSTSWW